jgi:CheY-like chemotaxis protein
MSGSATILVVDDEILVRTLLRKSLAARGFQILEAGTGEEALSVARDHVGPIDLLLTDIRMPGVSGWQVAAEFRPMYPDARIIFMSGFSDEVRNGLQAGEAFVEKPFKNQVMLDAVQNLLDEPVAKRPQAVATNTSWVPPAESQKSVGVATIEASASPRPIPVARKEGQVGGWNPAGQENRKVTDKLMQLEWQLVRRHR